MFWRADVTGWDQLIALAAIPLAALICGALIVAIMPLLARYALARPNARSSHKIPTPQGAGIAVIAATLVVATLAMMLIAPAPGIPVLLFGMAVLIAMVGTVDDIRPIPVLPRLALQALAVGLVIAALPVNLQIMPMLPVWIERAVLVIAALWFVNLVNFMDGLDWMTVSEVMPLTLALVVFGFAGALPVDATLIAAALGGAMLGFAPFNRPAAKVFLGDVGSLPIGLLLGWCLLQLALHGHLAAALLLPLYYLADSTLTLVRRILQREAFWEAHRSHYYQRATDNGFPVTGVVGRVFVVNLLLAVLAGVSVAVDSAVVDVAMLIGGAAAVGFILAQFGRPVAASLAR
ncbi:glycosyltransferase family 4 protein [Rhodopseudomonas sp. HC1]|uniref:MraY family glycosyltransferase n=1 Tax=Rhodopseudomonas infernalis TaxID=2897386 RepID=UPI001EE78B15|nr:glycosyltransferase family 4 protein [Rhodopseudomonas infernalis]MCG6207751.1 glycosyltransferase family 4 protein [Rhodopseudomonas infernalis]